MEEKKIETPKIEKKPISMKQLQEQIDDLKAQLLEQIKEKKEVSTLYDEVRKKLSEKEDKVKYAPFVPSGGKRTRSYTEEEKEEMRMKDRELVVGTFRFYDVKDGGGHVKFPFHKWRNDPVEEFLLIDGERYALPRGVVTHLRENGTQIIRAGMTELGKPDMRKPVKKRRYHFEIEDFHGDIDKVSRGYAPKSNY